MKIAPDMLRSFVERIERLDEEGKQVSDDKRDVYAEAKAFGFDVKALKAVVSRRRKDPSEAEEHEAIVQLYLDTLQGKSETGTRSATRAGASDEYKSTNVARPSTVPAVEMPDIPDNLRRVRA